MKSCRNCRAVYFNTPPIRFFCGHGLATKKAADNQNENQQPPAQAGYDLKKGDGNEREFQCRN